MTTPSQQQFGPKPSKQPQVASSPQVTAEQNPLASGTIANAGLNTYHEQLLNYFREGTVNVDDMLRRSGKRMNDDTKERVAEYLTNLIQVAKEIKASPEMLGSLSRDERKLLDKFSGDLMKDRSESATKSLLKSRQLDESLQSAFAAGEKKDAQPAPQAQVANTSDIVVDARQRMSWRRWALIQFVAFVDGAMGRNRDYEALVPDNLQRRKPPETNDLLSKMLEKLNKLE